jgi:hypothetical protein
MRVPESGYLRWAKALPQARINLARSGVVPCPPALLRLRAADLVTNLPVRDGYEPLLQALARRYRVEHSQVYAVSGGTSFANWLACAAILDGVPRGAEVIVERPTYEPLQLIPQALGVRVRRLDRRFADGYAIDLDRFGRLITPRTTLAIVSHLHNPSGTALDGPTLAAMASRLATVGATLLVDEVYAECLFGRRPASAVHAADNVVVTNSLTKAYGLDGLRAGWMLGPAQVIARAARIDDLMANSGVAPGERMALAALRRLPAIRRRAQAFLKPNLDRMRRYLREEPRLSAVVPPGGTVIFPRLPPGLDGDMLADHLRDRYGTLIVPGRFFEAPNHVRVSFGVPPATLARGLRALSLALDETMTQM